MSLTSSVVRKETRLVRIERTTDRGSLTLGDLREFVVAAEGFSANAPLTFGTREFGRTWSVAVVESEDLP